MCGSNFIRGGPGVQLDREITQKSVSALIILCKFLTSSYRRTFAAVAYHSPLKAYLSPRRRITRHRGISLASQAYHSPQRRDAVLKYDDIRQHVEIQSYYIINTRRIVFARMTKILLESLSICFFANSILSPKCRIWGITRRQISSSCILLLTRTLNYQATNLGQLKAICNQCLKIVETFLKCRPKINQMASEAQ